MLSTILVDPTSGEPPGCATWQLTMCRGEPAVCCPLSVSFPGLMVDLLRDRLTVWTTYDFHTFDTHVAYFCSACQCSHVRVRVRLTSRGSAGAGWGGSGAPFASHQRGTCACTHPTLSKNPKTPNISSAATFSRQGWSLTTPSTLLHFRAGMNDRRAEMHHDLTASCTCVGGRRAGTSGQRTPSPSSLLPRTASN